MRHERLGVTLSRLEALSHVIESYHTQVTIRRRTGLRRPRLGARLSALYIVKYIVPHKLLLPYPVLRETSRDDLDDASPR